MRIINLTKHSRVYTSNVYLVLGTWNAMEDVNALVDAGRDPSIIEKINTASTGVGKPKVEQVVLTHNHYDHAGLLPRIREVFTPTVHAFSRSLEGVDCHIQDGDILKLGDGIFDVIHTPGHSSDSVCLYCAEEGILFSGDTPVVIQSVNGNYEQGFIRALEKLCRKDIRSIYFGHGDPVLDNGNALIRASLNNVRKKT